jgi:hypothetical protein
MSLTFIIASFALRGTKAGVYLKRLAGLAYRILRRIFRPKRDEVTGVWGKLHNEELHILYSSPNLRNLAHGVRQLD